MMKTAEQQFANWSMDVWGHDAYRPHHWYRLGNWIALFSACLMLLTFCLFLLTRIEALVSVGSLLIATMFVGIALQRRAERKFKTMKPLCLQCGKLMECMETRPEKYFGDEFVVGKSGHVYKLVRTRGFITIAYEVRSQWMACESCKRYFPLQMEVLTDIGLGTEAIQDQERTYQRIDDLMATMSKRGHR